VVHQNEAFRVEVRYSDDVTGDPYVLEDGRMRAIMPMTDGAFDPDGVDVELFEVVPTQAVDGWITGFVPQSTIALCPVGVGRYDLALQFEDDDRMRDRGGSLEVREGISEW
jgi:hypothetical protein